MKKLLLISLVMISISACTQPATTNSNKSEFTVAEVATHNKESDCWTIIENKVYDITGYINSHPGGKENILIACGTDATSMFNSRPEDGTSHSNTARRTLERFLKGELKN